MANEADKNLQPWPIRMLNKLVWDDVPRRLGADAMALAVVLIQKQNWEYERPVGFWIGQLAERFGEVTADGTAVKNPRRTRAAREALMADGWLDCKLPKNGDRTQAVYRMVEKLTPGENGVGKQMTPTEIDGGKGLTPVKTVASPPANPLRHPRQNGSASTLLYTPHNSIHTTPHSHTPFNPPQGEEIANEDDVFSLTGDKPKTKRARNGKPDQATLTAQAETIYEAYPRKTQKQNALRAIVKALKVVPFEQLLERVTAYATAVKKWPLADQDFVPYPASWMNKGSWTDEPPAWERHSTGRITTLAGNAGQTYDQNAREKDPFYGKL